MSVNENNRFIEVAVYPVYYQVEEYLLDEFNQKSFIRYCRLDKIMKRKNAYIVKTETTKQKTNEQKRQKLSSLFLVLSVEVKTPL